MTVLALDDTKALEHYAALTGCTVAQLKHAIETVGCDEIDVRRYLESLGHMPPQHPAVLASLADPLPE